MGVFYKKDIQVEIVQQAFTSLKKDIFDRADYLPILKKKDALNVRK